MGHGIEDWQDTEDFTPEDAEAFVVPAGQTSGNSGDLNMRGWRGILIAVPTTTVKIGFSIQHRLTTASGVQVFSESFHLNGNDAARVFVPALANELRLIANLSAALGADLEITFLRSNRVTERYFVHPPTPLLSQTRNVAAGGSSVIGFSYPYAGRAHLSLETDAAAWSATLRGETFDAGPFNWFILGGDATFEGFSPIEVPSLINEVRFLNNDSAQRSFKAHISPAW